MLYTTMAVESSWAERWDVRICRGPHRRVRGGDPTEVPPTALEPAQNSEGGSSERPRFMWAY